MYPEHPPELVPVDITNDTVTAVAGQLSGGAWPRGKEPVSLQHWLLRFRAASEELRLIVTDFTEWLKNEQTPRAAYRAMMSGRLIAMDMHPGVRPVEV